MSVSRILMIFLGVSMVMDIENAFKWPGKSKKEKYGVLKDLFREVYRSDSRLGRRGCRCPYDNWSCPECQVIIAIRRLESALFQLATDKVPANCLMPHASDYVQEWSGNLKFCDLLPVAARKWAWCSHTRQPELADMLLDELCERLQELSGDNALCTKLQVAVTELAQKNAQHHETGESSNQQRQLSAENYKWPGNSLNQKLKLIEDVFVVEVGKVWPRSRHSSKRVPEGRHEIEWTFGQIQRWYEPEARKMPKLLSKIDKMLDKLCQLLQDLVEDAVFCVRMREKATEWAQRMGIGMKVTRQETQVINLSGPHQERQLPDLMRQLDLNSKKNEVKNHDEAVSEKSTVVADNNRMCSICLGEERQIAFGPCGYIATCEEFSNKLEKEQNVCSLCRQTINQRMRIFLP